MATATIKSNSSYELVNVLSDVPIDDDDIVVQIQDEKSIHSNTESGKCFVVRIYDQYKHIIRVCQSLGTVITTTVDVVSDIVQFFVYLS